MSHQTVKQGSSLTHRCTAVGQPPPRLRWQINGVTVSSSQLRYRITSETMTPSATGVSVTSSLSVSDMIPSDSLVPVECVAISSSNNSIQVATSTAAVTVISESVCLCVLIGLSMFFIDPLISPPHHHILFVSLTFSFELKFQVMSPLQCSIRLTTWSL